MTMTRTLNEPNIKSSPRGRTPARARKPAGAVEVGGFGVAIIAALVWGWINRGQHPTAESGVGYYLGITGALSMLALLAYPLRKHVRVLRGLGPVAFWFRTHMALGIIGPTLILYHANFQLGSMNANVALWSMLTVAGSGLVGRYIYAKLHRGLYGARAQMRDLLEEARAFRTVAGVDDDAELTERFERLEQRALAEPKDIMAAAAKAASVVAEARKLRSVAGRRLRARMKGSSRDKRSRHDFKEHSSFSRRYFQRIEQAAELSVYERLFSAWHLLHLPLFILLILTAVVHVVAVHLY